MKLKFFLSSLILLSLLIGCADYKLSSNKKDLEKTYYSSKGFALIYDEDLYKEKIINKKINNSDIKVMHSTLKPNTPILITNPDNSRSVETKIHKRANYPKIFNVIISKKISDILDIDINNPYVEIIEIKKNKTFIAREGTIFDEEKNVADKAPVDEITMDDLSLNKKKKKETYKEKSNFILVISDFYYIDTANNLKKDLLKKIDLNNIYVKKINDTKYRLLVGPFKNFNALKSTYISLNNLGFEELMVYKEWYE